MVMVFYQTLQAFVREFQDIFPGTFRQRGENKTRS